MLKFESLAQAKRETGLSYLGMVNNSTKHEKAYKYQEMVYTIYLSPAKSSGYEVCPMRTEECTLLCLNESGRNKMVSDQNPIPNARITKTKLFFENREFFVRWVINEITSAKKKAEKNGFRFSVRLNNTSDISPESFFIIEDGTVKNILELFPTVQFYDYTKVYKRITLMKKYPNYDVTFSYSGSNMDEVIKAMNNNIRVAIVFKKVPEFFMGREVIDGDQYDMRYLNSTDSIVGLKFKSVQNKLQPEYSFVIQEPEMVLV